MNLPIIEYLCKTLKLGLMELLQEMFPQFFGWTGGHEIADGSFVPFRVDCFDAFLLQLS